MGRYVVKAAPDRDAYFWWSTIVDAPVFLGDRAAMLAELDTPRRGEEWLRAGEAEKMLAAADLRGTSIGYQFPNGLRDADGAWDDRWMSLMEGVTKSGMIARDRLGELYDREMETDNEDTNEPTPTDDLVLSWDEWEEAGHNAR